MRLFSPCAKMWVLLVGWDEGSLGGKANTAKAEHEEEFRCCLPPQADVPPQPGERGHHTQRVCHRSQRPHCSFLSPCFYHEHTPWHSRAGVPQHPSAPQPARWWAGQGAERTGLWASTLSSSYDIRLLSAVFITNPKQSATGATRK